MLTASVLFLSMVVMLMPASALSLPLKEKYAPAETIITQIEGEVLTPITPQQIEVRRGHVLVPVEYDIQQLGSVTYLWMGAPRAAGNYTLILKDVQARQEGVAAVVRLEKNFSVEGESAAYAVRPAVIAPQRDFELTVEVYRDGPQLVEVSHPQKHETLLVPGMNVFAFPLSAFRANEVGFLTIGMYRVPVYVQGSLASSSNDSSDRKSTLQTAFWEVVPTRIDATIASDERLPSYVVHATYRGNATLKNVKVSYNKSILRVQPELFKTLAPNQSIELNVSITKRLSERYNGALVLGEGNASLSVPVELVFLANAAAKNRTANASALPYCSELSGIVCSKGDGCSTEVIESRDGTCCTGVCEQEKKSRAWVGFLLLGVLALIVAFAWMNYKKVKPREPLHTAKSGRRMQEFGSVAGEKEGKEK